MTEHQQEHINQMCRIIEVTINNNEMTKCNKEWYLNTSWKLIMNYVRECNGTITKEDR